MKIGCRFSTKTLLSDRFCRSMFVEVLGVWKIQQIGNVLPPFAMGFPVAERVMASTGGTFPRFDWIHFRHLPSFSRTLVGVFDTDPSCLCREIYFIMDSKFVAAGVWIKSAFRISMKESLRDHPVVVQRKLPLQIICSASGDRLNIENQKSWKLLEEYVKINSRICPIITELSFKCLKEFRMTLKNKVTSFTQ